MIERWLQITCDECGETDNSTWPNMTIAEFRADIARHFVKRGKRDLCGGCAEVATARDQLRSVCEAATQPRPRGRRSGS